ncbi:MAG: T9SS type A sorting domain-containing protein [Thermonemataceae bacterium]|nr:T9SS type A sorting domain-containing protein [Thermonemataceae bacterium]
MKNLYTKFLLQKLFFFFFLLSLQTAWGQVSEDFNSWTGAASYGTYTYNGFRIATGLRETTNFRGASGSAVRMQNSGTPYIEYEGSDGNGKDGGAGTVSFWYRHWDGSPAITTITVSYSVNGGAYTTIGTISSFTSTTYTQFTYDINDSSDNIKVRVQTTGQERLIVDDFSITDYASGPPAITLADNGTQITAANVAQGTSAHVLHKFSLAVTTANTTLTGVQVTTIGTYASADLSNLKVRYSTDATLDAGDATLSTYTSVPTAGTLTFPSFTSQAINSATTGYIFITADIAGSATLGNTIRVDAVTTGQLTFSSGTKSGSTTAGGTQTFIACTPTNVTGASASSLNTQSGVSWALPSCYDQILVVANTSAGIGFTPSGDGTAYTANAAYAGVNSVVYKGTGTSVTVTSLTNGTTYYFEIFTRKGTTWSAGVEVSATPVAGPCLSEDFTSGSFPAGWIRSSTTTVNVASSRINMDAANCDFTMLALSNPTQLTFDLARTTNTTSKTLNIKVSTTSQTTGFTNVAAYTHSNTTSGGTTACTVDLSAYVGFSTVYIRFEKVSTTTSPWRIDNINVNCGTPGTLPVSNVLTTQCTTEATLSWTKPGNYVNANNTILVFAKQGAAITEGTPTNAVATYTANSDFSAAGTAYQNDAAAKCVYKGDANSFTVTGLTSGQTYHFLVLNVLDASSTYSSGATANATTSTIVTNPIGFSASPGNAQVTLTWENPACYDEVLIVARASAVSSGRPTGDGTAYTANNSFGSGTSLLGGFVVYKNNGQTTTTVSLTNGTTYCFKIFTRKGTAWSSGSQVCVTPTATVQPTVLTPGDIVIVGYNSIHSGSTDRFYLTTFVDLEVGTKFAIVNSRYESGAAANVRTDTWWAGGSNYNAESPGIAEFTVATKVLKGSIIRFESTAAFPTPDVPQNITVFYNNAGVLASSTTAITGAVVNPGGLSGYNVNISSSGGDQIWLVQGTGADAGFSPVAAGVTTSGFKFNGKVLYALTSRAPWVATSATPSTGSGSTDRESRLHPDIECFNVATGIVEQAFYKNNALHTGSKRQLLLSVQEINEGTGNLQNWTLNTISETTQLTNESDANTNVGELFTVNPGNLSGTWIGDSDTDWFNCGNWEALTVPDNTVDVYFDENSVGKARIDVSAFSTNATKFSSIAQAKNLTITNQTLEFGTTSGGSTSDRLDVYGDLVISGGILDMNTGSANDGVINLQGNWENQTGSTGFEEGNGTINLMGSTAEQTILSNGTEDFANLTINNSNNVRLLSDVNASKVVTFTAGKLFTYNNADYYKFTVESTGSLSGYNSSRYFVTRGDVNNATCFLVQNVTTASKVFPIGTATTYNPVTMQFAAGSSDVQMRVFDGVYVNGIRGASVSNIAKWVNKTWEITPTTPASSTITLQWNGSDENASFTRATSEMFKNRSDAVTDLAWEAADGSETFDAAGGANPYTKTRSGITTYSKFGVASETPLPVELLNFSGFVNSNNDAVLEWQTVAEIALQGFELEKSTDGQHFTKIASLNAKGETTNAYSSTDTDFAKLSYYRLRIVDTDASFRYSQTIALDINSTRTAKLLLYPNPASQADDLKLLLGDRTNVGKMSLQIFAQSGKAIAQISGTLEEVEQGITAKMRELPKSLYVIHLQTEAGEIYTTKFVKK